MVVVVGTSFVFYPSRAAEYIWLCASQGHHRVAFSGFKLNTKVFLVALLVPSGLLAHMVPGRQRPKP